MITIEGTDKLLDYGEEFVCCVCGEFPAHIINVCENDEEGNENIIRVNLYCHEHNPFPDVEPNHFTVRM